MKNIMIDISWPINNTMTTYKNRGGVEVERMSIVERDGVGQSRIMCDSHTGTHVDAPAHFIAGGKTIDQIPLEHINGTCFVFEIPRNVNVIMPEHITACIEQVCANGVHNNISEHIVLFKTANSRHHADALFDQAFVYLSFSAAEYLVNYGVKAVGIDYLGIERGQPAHETHTILLSAGIPIIEGLRLEHVNTGCYHLICLPLSIPGIDAAPARAVLMSL
jgi:arylformamidase